jgi:CBS domain-containing protein
MRVSDVMTRRVIFVTPKTTIVDAIRLMLKNHISGLPVIDHKSKLVGMVTEGDFLRRAENPQPYPFEYCQAKLAFGYRL